jgi:hypothetical protein
MEKRQLSHRRGEDSYKQPDIFPFQSSSTTISNLIKGEEIND